MRRQQNILPYLFTFASLILLLSLPNSTTQNARGISVAMMAPAWNSLGYLKTLLQTPIEAIKNHGDGGNVATCMQQLEMENIALKAENVRLRELFHHELGLLSQLTAGAPFPAHEHELKKIIDIQLSAIPAQVIFRPPSSWNSSLWINVGEEDNPAIQKNSPVLVGKAIVGVIDYLGKHQSRVRLITDSGLNPSVRAARGDPHRRLLLENLQSTLSTLATRNDLIAHQGDKAALSAILEKTRDILSKEEETFLLAKGEIHGSSLPLWRGRSQRLTGVGFNYDFADEEGPARDLMTGKAINAAASIAAISILQEGDLLVTTGMDGVFPEGLHAAIVTKVHELKEGDYTYALEAVPAAGDLQQLSFVYIIPPVRSE